MRSQTIYRAMSGAYRTILFTQTIDAFLHRKARQWAKFERELLRRMDERDADVGPAKAYRALERLWPVYRGVGNSPQERTAYIDCLQRELAEARAYISTVIDAPKDYPAEGSA